MFVHMYTKLAVPATTVAGEELALSSETENPVRSCPCRLVRDEDGKLLSSTGSRDSEFHKTVKDKANRGMSGKAGVVDCSLGHDRYGEVSRPRLWHVQCESGMHSSGRDA